MNCTKFERLVNDLAGHDLAPEMSARLTEHARRCERCAGEWRAALERAAALQTMTPWSLEAKGIKPPRAGETADAVFARLARGEGSKSTLREFTRPLAAAAGFLVLVGASFFAWNVMNAQNAINRQNDSNRPGASNEAAPLHNNNNAEVRIDHSFANNSGSAVPILNVNASGERVLDPQETKLLLESAFQGVWPDFNLRNVTSETPNSSGQSGTGVLRFPMPYDPKEGGPIKLFVGARRF